MGNMRALCVAPWQKQKTKNGVIIAPNKTMLFPRLSIQQEPLDNGEYDSDASDDDVTEQELIDAANAAAKGDIEVGTKLLFCFVLSSRTHSTLF